MKILVTGAAGYIGQGLIKRLIDDGNEVIATDFVFDQESKMPEVRTVECNLFNVENPYEYFEEPDIVFHLAWRNGFEHNNLTHINDLPLHYNFLSKMIMSGIKRVTVMGSMHEIGFFEGAIRASTKAEPTTLYGISKNALRQAIQELTKQNNVQFQWIRGYYIVGNTEKGSSIFSKLTKAEAEGKEFFPFTSGQNQWDFLDYDEFCDQLTAIVEQNNYLGIINACSGFPEKLADRVERFIKDNGFQIKLNYGSFPDRPYDSKAVWGDNEIITKIMEERAYEVTSEVQNLKKNL